MAEAALRSCGAAGTPRKRSRDPDGFSCWEFRTPERKRLRALPEPPARNSHQENREEEEEEEAFPGKSARSLRLDIPAGNLGIPGNSQPGSTSSHNSQLPVGAFYGKRIYLDPLERKRLRELLGDGNSTEKPGNSGNPGGNSGNPGRNPSRNSSGNRSSKSKPNPKARREIPKGKSSGNAGNSRSSEAGSSQNSRISQNSRNSERFRVLSAGVRPPLRLPLGSAFFLSGKRSRKNPGNSSGKSSGDSGAASRDPSEKAWPGPEKAGEAEKAGEESAGRIPEAQEEEKENRECSGEPGTAGNGTRNSEGKEVRAGIGENSREFPDFTLGKGSEGPREGISLGIPGRFLWGFPWDFPLGFLGESLGIPWEFSWDFPWEFLWDFWGDSLGIFPWDSRGIPWEFFGDFPFLWDIFPRAPDFPWEKPGSEFQLHFSRSFPPAGIKAPNSR
ncbi:uncharacterized protein LOC107198947 [Parus major]|uniref:uncharacterized protein LOC107198947 n=1 Tax=Parus major TaxID=9157 RepID=UPI001443935B|nr:uncharacterized protein LOC107198947 [Parus major]